MVPGHRILASLRHERTRRTFCSHTQSPGAAPYSSEFPQLLGGVGRKKLRPSLFSAVLGKGPSLKNEVMNNPSDLCDEATEKISEVRARVQLSGGCFPGKREALAPALVVRRWLHLDSLAQLLLVFLLFLLLLSLDRVSLKRASSSLHRSDMGALELVMTPPLLGFLVS